MTITIHFGPHRLTDGSEVFNVHIGDEGSAIPAVSEDDARAFADALAEAFQRHTLTDVRVRRWEVRAA